MNVYPILRRYIKVVLSVIFAINGLKDCSRETKAIVISKASKDVPLNPVALKTVKVGAISQDILASSRTQAPSSPAPWEEGACVLVLSLYRKDAVLKFNRHP